MLLAELPSIAFDSVLTVAPIVLAVVLGLGGLLVCLTSRKVQERPRRNILSLAVYLVFLAVVVGLAVTSFGTIVQFGHMSGYALLLHVTGAGAFVFLLLAIAYLFLPRGDAGRVSNNEQRWWVSRWSAWALVIGGILAAGTMFLSMLPVLDTSGLLLAAELHRYAGLVVVAAAIIHLYALCCTRLGLR